MAFSIESTAREYVNKRFPKASSLEQEKIIADWRYKIRDSQALVDDFKKRVGDPRGKKLLDAGSGNGGLCIAFSRAGADVCGVEIEKELYEISKQHAEALGSNPTFHLYDGNKLPFSDNYFDFATSASVLEHTDDPVAYLGEIARVLKPDGRLYLGFPNKWTPKETHTQLLFLTYIPMFLRPLYVKIFRRNPLPANNLHFYGYSDLIKMLKKINKIHKGRFSFEIVGERGSSHNPLKRVVKFIMRSLGLSYKMLLPHILIILEKHERSQV